MKYLRKGEEGLHIAATFIVSLLLWEAAVHLFHIRPFVLPAPRTAESPWELLFDTARTDLDWTPMRDGTFELQPCSMAAFAAKVPRDDDLI